MSAQGDSKKPDPSDHRGSEDNQQETEEYGQEDIEVIEFDPNELPEGGFSSFFQ
jgi:hypothetical protein